jgi:hypothetical protein
VEEAGAGLLAVRGVDADLQRLRRFQGQITSLLQSVTRLCEHADRELMRRRLRHEAFREVWQLLRDQGHDCHLLAVPLHSRGVVQDASGCTERDAELMFLVHWEGMGPWAAGGQVISMMLSKTLTKTLWMLDRFSRVVYLCKPQLRPPTCKVLAQVLATFQATQAQRR